MKDLIFEFNKIKSIIPKGSTIYLEIDLIRLKNFFYKKNYKVVLEFLLNEFKKIIGKNGNLIVPAFTYSWGKDNNKKIFDIKKTLPKTGMFPNFLFLKKEVLRTNDPMFSFLILGKDKKKLSTIGKSSFGKRSLFEKIDKDKTYLVSFGLERFDPTFVHYVEEYFDRNYKKINYRFSKKYNGLFKKHNKFKKDFFHSFSRNLKLNMFYNEKKIKKILLKKKKLKIVNFHSFEVFITLARDFFNEGILGMKNDQFFFVKHRQ